METFTEFDNRCPQVYAELLRLARQAKAAGFKKFGIRTIWEAMRWNFALERRGLYRFNDHMTAAFARKLMAENPELDGFFELRTRR